MFINQPFGLILGTALFEVLFNQPFFNNCYGLVRSPKVMQTFYHYIVDLVPMQEHITC